MGLLAWIIFGAIAGWTASLVAGRSARQGCVMDIVIGIVGAFIGGFLFELLTGRRIGFGFNVGSFVVAVLGALVLLFIVERLRVE